MTTLQQVHSHCGDLQREINQLIAHADRIAVEREFSTTKPTKFRQWPADVLARCERGLRKEIGRLSARLIACQLAIEDHERPFAPAIFRLSVESQRAIAELPQGPREPASVLAPVHASRIASRAA